MQMHRMRFFCVNKQRQKVHVHASCVCLFMPRENKTGKEKEQWEFMKNFRQEDFLHN